MTFQAAAQAAPRRTISRHYRAPEGDFPALPADMQRERFLSLIDRVAGNLVRPVSAAAMRLFRTMAEMTRPRDWTSTTAEPCCYAQQVELAHITGLSVSRVRALETELVSAALIEKRSQANGARSGFSGCGIFFSIAISRLDQFRATAEQVEQDRHEHARLRGLRSTHKGHLKALLDELRGRAGASDVFCAIEAAYQEWPSADALHRMSLADLAEHESQAEQLTRAAFELQENIEKTSGRPPVFERSYIQDTTQEKKVSCNASVNTQGAGKPAQDNSLTATPEGVADCREQNDRSSDRVLKGDLVDKITPQRLYHLASEDMRLYLDALGKSVSALSLYDFVTVARRHMMRELGINDSVWRLAEELMDEESAMLCLLITDAKRTDKAAKVYNPGGYMRGMVRACQRGDLHLMGSLIGLAERRRNEE